jgi:Endonuclease/Exonuclease/phosphatase family
MHKPLSRRDMRVSCSLQMRFLFVVALVCSCLLTPSVSFVRKMTRMVNHISRQSSLRMVAKTILSGTDETSFKVVSFNILAPCYNKVKGEVNPEGGAVMEAEFKDKYMERNQAICNQLIQSNADIICLQEYWSGSEELRDLYKSTLCGPKGAGYTFTEQRRTSHWRIRDDGLACFVKDERIVIQDTRAILFHDCGDRVAQMLLLALRPPVDAPSDTPAQQFICVNTHLLFPHNEYSTKIRLRELAKILGFVESYRMRELCSTICGRSDVSHSKLLMITAQKMIFEINVASLLASISRLLPKSSTTNLIQNDLGSTACNNSW